MRFIIEIHIPDMGTGAVQVWDDADDGALAQAEKQFKLNMPQQIIRMIPNGTEVQFKIRSRFNEDGARNLKEAQQQFNSFIEQVYHFANERNTNKYINLN